MVHSRPRFGQALVVKGHPLAANTADQGHRAVGGGGRSSVYSAARQLLEAGVPLSNDPVEGFTLELANYTYAYPHNHLKLLVIDGQETAAGGVNSPVGNPARMVEWSAPASPSC